MTDHDELTREEIESWRAVMMSNFRNGINTPQINALCDMALRSTAQPSEKQQGGFAKVSAEAQARMATWPQERRDAVQLQGKLHYERSVYSASATSERPDRASSDRDLLLEDFEELLGRMRSAAQGTSRRAESCADDLIDAFGKIRRAVPHAVVSERDNAPPLDRQQD